MRLNCFFEAGRRAYRVKRRLYQSAVADGALTGLRQSGPFPELEPTFFTSGWEEDKTLTLRVERLPDVFEMVIDVFLGNPERYRNVLC